MKKLVAFFALFALIATLVAACGGSTPSTSSNGSAGSGNTVHLSDATFAQTSITIKKGESVNLVNDVSAVHIIQNGAWDSSGSPKSAKEAGAPDVQAVQVQGGGSQTVGPFTTAGTFQLYCTVHPGMNLTVVVQ